jgi:hypothetical protein
MLYGKVQAESATWSHTHIPESARECERMSPHTPKWTPTLGIRVFKIFEFLKRNLRGRNSLDSKVPYTIEKFLRHRYLKWDCMIHLSIYKTSYGWKKDEESKCQFGFWPLKVRNRLELCACRLCATYHWKDFGQG